MARRIRFFITLLIFLPLLTTGALHYTSNFKPLEVDKREHLRFSYYDVHGGDILSLQKGLKANGPLDLLGMKRYALTSWQIDWQWPLDRAERPSYPEMVTTLNVEITLPQWNPPADCPQETITEWNRFYEALLQHEMSHLKIVRENFHRIKSEILARSWSTDALDPLDANKIAMAELQKIREIDDEYDRSTNNGKNEGVVLRTE